MAAVPNQKRRRKDDIRILYSLARAEPSLTFLARMQELQKSKTASDVMLLLSDGAMIVKQVHT